jgi:hypothetical protein
MEKSTMKKWLWRHILRIGTGAFLLLYILAATGNSEELIRLPLDSTASLGTTISTDATIKKEGNGSIRITTLWPTTICIGEIPALNVENARLVYRARVKSEKIEGHAFLEMWCEVGSGRYFSRGMDSAVTGSMDWKTLQTPFLLQTGQKARTVTLNIVINGKGTIWIDDVALLREPLQ